MMGMRMVQAPMLRMGCLTCGGYSDEHVRNCPQKAIEELFEKELRFVCPKCRGAAAVDLDDLIQCRKCKTLFSFLVGRVANPDDPEKMIIYRANPDPDWVEVLVLADKGQRLFRTDHALGMLREQQKVWRARLREERRIAREPKRRHARAAPCQICGPLYCRYAP